MVPRASHTLNVCREELKTSGFALGFQHFFKPAGILPARICIQEKLLKIEIYSVRGEFWDIALLTVNVNKLGDRT